MVQFKDHRGSVVEALVPIAAYAPLWEEGRLPLEETSLLADRALLPPQDDEEKAPYQEDTLLVRDKAPVVCLEDPSAEGPL